jgi:nitroreductase
MMSVLDQTILERHSIRKFLPLPVSREVVDEALALAQHAPSNSNIQPWRLVFASGAARERLRDALFRAAGHEAPHIPALPKAFEHYRYQLGAEVRRAPDGVSAGAMGEAQAHDGRGGHGHDERTDPACQTQALSREGARCATPSARLTRRPSTTKR